MHPSHQVVQIEQHAGTARLVALGHRHRDEPRIVKPKVFPVAVSPHGLLQAGLGVQEVFHADDDFTSGFGTPDASRGNDQLDELVTADFPLDLAHGTALSDETLMSEGARHQIESRNKIRYDHVTERIAARLPSGEEALLLGLPSKKTPVLAMTVTASEASGRPVQLAELVLPSDRDELEHTYPLV